MPAAFAQSLLDFLEFEETEVAYEGITPSLGFSGYVAEEPFDFNSKRYSGGVSVVDTTPPVFTIEGRLNEANGLGYDLLPPFEAAPGTVIFDDSLRVSFGDVTIGGPPAYEGCYGIEGSTGPFSNDVYVIRADVGAPVPGLSLASQFRCQYVPREEPTPTEDARVYYLRAGPIRNEFTFRTMTYADDAVDFNDPVQVDEGVGQITGYDLGFLILRFRGAGSPATIAVWDSFGSNGDDSSLLSVQARALDSDGVPVGGQFQVNTFTTNNQSSARVSGSAQRYVVVWTSQGSPGNDDSLTSVQARLFEADGTPVGDQFQVNQATMGDQFEPDVVMLEDGSFFIVWTDIALIDSQILGRAYTADGTAAGDAIQLTDNPGADMPKLESNGRDVLVLWRRPDRIESRFAISRIFRDGFEGADS
ncbi:MAG: hypothetical protein AAF446_06255 [Pseudomonadota bacterium]